MRCGWCRGFIDPYTERCIMCGRSPDLKAEKEKASIKAEVDRRDDEQRENFLASYSRGKKRGSKAGSGKKKAQILFGKKSKDDDPLTKYSPTFGRFR